MKYIIVLLVFLFCCNDIFSQDKSGVKSVIGASSSQKKNIRNTRTQTVNGVNKTFTIESVNILVGSPYLGLTKGATSGAPSTQNYQKDLGFPWGIRYLYNTFSEDAFTVSKGYYSDRIEINWDIKKNQEKIVSIIVFRTEDITSTIPNWGNPLKILAADVGTFSDTNVEGGKLYRYKLLAKGVEAEGLEVQYSNFITGIGYRNPTGVITGNISYTGGNPVRDVLVTANPTGATLRFGSSLKLPTNSYISVPKLHKGLKDSITMQAWVKPLGNFTNDELVIFNLLGTGANESIPFSIALHNNILSAKVLNHTISLSNFIPSGEIDNKGDDVLIPINSINNAFNHFSVVLRNNEVPEIYINGRLISQEYIQKMNAVLAQNSSTASQTVAFSTTNKPVNINIHTDRPTWISFRSGGKKSAYIDELIVWETALNSSQIQRDYRRYLKGNESYLHTYIRANEKTGDFAYDLAHTGFNFHGNDAKLSHSPIAPSWANSEDNINNIPTNTQLGVLGVSDEFGNYVISSVPFSGNGDSFTIVPSLGKHEFNPKQVLVFLGVGSTVVNNVDFIDKSSFVFKGLVVYDSRGVFPATSDAPITGDIKEDESYNAYVIGNLKYQKGEYWAEKDKDGTIIQLNRYATIPVPDAYVYIDNIQAIDANNVPVQTDIHGRFTIEVPIGKHAISVSKSAHTFDFEGRFPARDSTIINGVTYFTNTYKDFFEDSDEPITFIDNTKITVIGRVVGGKIESDKTIGFGFDGKKTFTYNDTSGAEITTTYTSINNIGSAQLTLGYMPVGANSITNEYKTSFTTNNETGEFRVNLLPLSYIISQNDLRFVSGINPDNNPLLTADMPINFTAIKAFQYPTFVQGSTTITGEPYQEILKFTHIAIPQHNVINQTSDTTITADGINYTISPNQNPPIYTQFADYSISIQSLERYFNYDINPNDPEISVVPVVGSTLIKTNNLALENSESIKVSDLDPSILIYSFKGGIPNTDSATNFKRTLNLKIRSNGIDYPVINYKTEGIILGGVADGSQTFVTAGPEIPDFVLRDPPGSFSSASIEKGSSFSFLRENTSNTTIGNETNATVSLGFTLSVGGGLAGPVMESETVADTTTGILMQQSSSNGKSITNTYTFNQTITTNSDPDWIGSDADLYIGTSANQFYGTYDELVVSSTSTNSTPINVLNASGVSMILHPKINKALYFSESPEKTLFVYSQRNILNDVIPKYQNFIDQIDNGTLLENQNGVLSREAYVSSINLWRKIILNNELVKYQAFKNRNALKTSLDDIVESLKDPETGALSETAKQLKDLLDATFYENISFDAGVGEFTKGFSVERLTTSTLSYELQIDSSVAVAIGADFNDTGFQMETTTNNTGNSSNTNEDTSDETTTISYTLSDTDPGNIFSVDVINPFDGNGPIFITKAGETSCPYETEELSYFYNPNHENVKNPSALIINLPESERIPLSVATIAIERPEITVADADVSDIFEGRNAEFVLNLRNTSTINKDATFILMVDQSTNPDNADINIEPNGTLITIPAGKTVFYTMTLKKVKQDQYVYDNIRIFLKSSCDDDAIDEVFVSASFVPACSPVTIMEPSNNWLLNRNAAFDGVNTKPLNIKLGDYNTTFDSFEKINLEYRLKGTPNWARIKTYYKNQSDYDIALNGGDTDIELIVGNQLNYAWDIAGLGLPNGTYQLRARSSCYNNTTFESDIIEGNVDLTAPVVFTTPTPKDGILNLGDDITIKFNEPVKTNSTVTRFEFLIQKNQLPVEHGVSLAFNGESNKGTITKPAIANGDFSIEFWLKNSNPNGTSTLLMQENGLKIELLNNVLRYTIGNESIEAFIANDDTFNHYALSYDNSGLVLSIIENDIEVQSQQVSNRLQYTNSESIVIGGNTFKGNIHDLRFWKKYISREEAVANMNTILNGNEKSLLGYWPINEGNGNIANDLARFKSLVITNANWDIKPKGTSYEFDGTNYLNFDKANKVIISDEMDATLSFWMKTNQTTQGTVLSNGKGNTTDPIEANGFRNKWAISINANNNLELQTEGKTYSFGNKNINDDTWHHFALSLTRKGTIRMYVDGEQLGSFSSAEIGGFSSANLFLGARGQIQASGEIIIDNYFNGFVDELCIWNMARNAEQIKNDQFFELDYESTGLLLYSPLNKPEVTNSFGPKYYYPFNAFEKTSDYAVSNKSISFSEVTPGIKPFRPTESIVLNPIFNGSEIVLVPDIADWASIEGKVAHIKVSNLNDLSDNSQLSPVTWTAFINKNPVKWFIEGQSGIVNLMQRTNESMSFEITLINKGGVEQPYSIDLPNWISVSAKSGKLAPNTTLILNATVDKNLAIGSHNAVLSLTTNYGYNEQIHLDFRVLEKEPNLFLDPTKYTESMNIIGKLKLNAAFTDDFYDKVIAVVNGEVRGIASVVFDDTFNEYFVFLTIYSNQVSGENVIFYIWDASEGKLKEATLNDTLSIAFLADEIIGSYTNPAIFNNTLVTGQQLLLNQGWTWVSFNVNDERFNRLNNLTKDLVLNTGNLFQSYAPALLDVYQYDELNPSESSWNGTISSNGGITSDKMYKIKLSSPQNFNIKGIPVDLKTWFFDVSQNWNWLPYVVSKNTPIGEALANLNATEGDFIKSQSLFASFSSSVGWKGSLTYLKAGEGYMLRSNSAQRFTYPDYLNQTSAKNSFIKSNKKGDIEDDILPYQYAQFPNTMSIIAKLPDGFENLYFYNDMGQLKGNATTQDVNGNNLAFITVYGDKPEKLIAYIGSGNTKQVTNKLFSFSTDAIMGSILEPIIIDLLEDKITLYPNPFQSDLEIAINADEVGVAQITMNNMLGQLVYENTFDLKSGLNNLKINPNIANATYILRIKIAGETMVYRIIKN
ncbi:LamG-like jellyroll fold domain-containing protein [Polaribacter gangjinensis]|uniref:Secretion system C-terminal sorting domain-containing protein n=1 Tax=Polaribacter gangjinensis TaxID=574710 RepID=A0A2S7WC46_9FLAO|nr:LamG-like jellyroll fold domain-containing protein [Polaribacter gangjinensis]PQJ75198.1 hypothetical protein BTO13_08040 [Polaribacter gangjinensis]